MRGGIVENFSFEGSKDKPEKGKILLQGEKRPKRYLRNQVFVPIHNSFIITMCHTSPKYILNILYKLSILQVPLRENIPISCFFFEEFIFIVLSLSLQLSAYLYQCCLG